MTPEEREALRKMSDKVDHHLLLYNQCATWVGLNDKGEVEVRILSNKQCEELIRKQEAGEAIPPTVRIAKI